MAPEAFAIDPSSVQGIVQGLYGQPCWKAAFTYGDELRLHIGERVPRTSQKLASKERGAWVFGTRGTAWQLKGPAETITSADPPEGLEERVHAALVNARVTDFQVRTGLVRREPVLLISFDNRYQLVVTPGPEDEQDDFPYWELFTPDKTVLLHGPQGLSRYQRDEVARRQQAYRKARKLVGMVQGTCQLEGCGVMSPEVLQQMVEQTSRELLESSDYVLWSD